ncbi:hypothetical protein BGW36DRAFT_422035 [Talaromyces proteolyticus]|uniref:Uncharacterized protein n=1 Tax=Talaromyces proteolyticus TaxID=1131652 RepID=A0AAD4L2N4_9EURO|nr:uncharacterized protein BGW36DRAFT_422035 [Talaromyces proteolyticus]KAH8705480.1 hypothetical protein BGW36DRAFT_422035 [Talaromyces proteolyticus]
MALNIPLLQFGTLNYEDDEFCTSRPIFGPEDVEEEAVVGGKSADDLLRPLRFLWDDEFDEPEDGPEAEDDHYQHEDLPTEHESSGGDDTYWQSSGREDEYSQSEHEGPENSGYDDEEELQANIPEDDDDESIHHYNLFNEAILQPSTTPPKHSLLYILSTSGRKPENSFWFSNGDFPKSSDLRTEVLLHQAQKWVDPVVYYGEPKDLHGLNGRMLCEQTDIFEKYLNKFYTPHGRWLLEKELKDEDPDEERKGNGEPILDTSNLEGQKEMQNIFNYNSSLQWTDEWKRLLDAENPQWAQKKSYKKAEEICKTLGTRRTERSSLHWSSTPDIDSVPENLSAEPCFHSSRGGFRGRELRSTFWWKREESGTAAVFVESPRGQQNAAEHQSDNDDWVEVDSDLQIGSSDITNEGTEIVKEVFGQGDFKIDDTRKDIPDSPKPATHSAAELTTGSQTKRDSSWSSIISKLRELTATKTAVKASATYRDKGQSTELDACR